VTHNVVPFNPLSTKNLGASVAEALLARAAVKLGEVPRFVGAGIYAIYYSGQFPAYMPIAKRNKGGKLEVPIYVGKAIPAGARTGGVGEATTTRALASRLGQHAQSVRDVSNLDIEDFDCRFLVVDDIWIPLGESLLIAKFSPLWNVFLDGFGNHDPGAGRHAGLRPRWDVLHPGRAWAARCKPRLETVKEIARDVEQHLRSTPLPQSQHMVDPEID